MGAVADDGPYGASMACGVTLLDGSVDGLLQAGLVAVNNRTAQLFGAAKRNFYAATAIS